MGHLLKSPRNESSSLEFTSFTIWNVWCLLKALIRLGRCGIYFRRLWTVLVSWPHGQSRMALLRRWLCFSASIKSESDPPIPPPINLSQTRLWRTAHVYKHRSDLNLGWSEIQKLQFRRTLDEMIRPWRVFTSTKRIDQNQSFGPAQSCINFWKWSWKKKLLLPVL